MAETPKQNSGDFCDISRQLTNAKSNASSHMKFTSSTTLTEVLKHNLNELERSNIINLKKDVIADLTVYTINKLYKPPSPSKLVVDPAMTKLQSLCKNLQDQISRTEASLLKRAAGLEESISKKVTDIQQNLQSPQSPYFNTNSNKPENVTSEHIVRHTENFIDEQCKKELLEFCTKLDFRSENGHGVVSFGEQYNYSRSQSDVPESIPTVVQSIIEKLLPDFPDAGTINQCLINRYEGPDSYLPRHCDDEQSISPTSSIFTFSIGSPTTVRFNNLNSGDQRDLTVNDCSLYVMSRRSQAFWSHGIEKSADFQSVRYSITLRTVGKRFNRSTIIQGDSNTKYLKFGKGKGTFGHYMPGETKYTPRIEDLDPSACIGYSNIIVHCGINDIKYNGCNVEECAKRLINKVEAIKSLCPKSKITLNPLLPSKSDFLNARATQFNRILFHYIDTRHDNLLQTVNFNVFQDEKSWLLKEDLGRFNNSRDLIHLGSSGIRLLVTIVKERVCGSRVDGRSYAGVTSGNRGMKRVGSVRVNRVSMNMMINPPTASDTLPAPSQQVQS